LQNKYTNVYELYSDEIVILEELGLDNMPDLFIDNCGIYKLTLMLKIISVTSNTLCCF